MTIYCKKNVINIEHEKEGLYEKYGVRSRRDMNPSDVKSEIGSYEA